MQASLLFDYDFSHQDLAPAKSDHLSAVPTRTKANANPGSFMEFSCHSGHGILPQQLLPLLAHTGAGDRWLMWLSPSCPINKAWLETQGLNDAPVVHLPSSKSKQSTLLDTIIKAGNAHVIIEWQGTISAQERSRISDMAYQSGSHVILVTQPNTH